MSTAACTWRDRGRWIGLKFQTGPLPDRRSNSRVTAILVKSAGLVIPPNGRRSMENIEQRVKKIVAEQLGVNEAEIKNESSFVDDLGADSLDTVELVMALEEEFETEIPDEEAEKITTVKQAIEFISAHVKK